MGFDLRDTLLSASLVVSGEETLRILFGVRDSASNNVRCLGVEVKLFHGCVIPQGSAKLMSSCRSLISWSPRTSQRAPKLSRSKKEESPLVIRAIPVLRPRSSSRKTPNRVRSWMTMRR